MPRFYHFLTTSGVRLGSDPKPSTGLWYQSFAERGTEEGQTLADIFVLK